MICERNKICLICVMFTKNVNIFPKKKVRFDSVCMDWLES